MRNTFVKTLCELAAEDERIWLLTGDLGFNLLDGFRDAYPGRFVNAGIAEQNMTGVAAGLALSGKVPFTYSIANFNTLRCLEQIRNDVCYHGLNVNIVSVGAGFTYGTQGYTHFALEDVAVMRVMPGMHVFSPGDVEEAAFVCRAMASLDAPCYVRLGAASWGGQPGTLREVGRASVLRQGGDAVIAATGSCLGHAVQAAENLAQKGMQCSVLSYHTLAPFDAEALRQAAAAAGRVVCVEEHGPGGLGTLAAEALAGMDGVRLALARPLYNRTDRVACQKTLCDRAGLHPGAIAEQVEFLLQG